MNNEDALAYDIFMMNTDTLEKLQKLIFFALKSINERLSKLEVVE